MIENKKQRVSLTKSHLKNPIGIDFLNLLTEVGQDGILNYDELLKLSDFLNANKRCGIPGVTFLFNLMIEVCSDQNITSEELVDIQLGIEKVLPPDYRSEIKRSRLSLAPPPLPDAATERQLDYIRILGGTATPGLTKWEASELISQLKWKPPASPRQIMFLRFWGRMDLIGCSRDEITDWMSLFIDEDERRKRAWNRYKQEIKDDGSQRDPSFVPIGIGTSYL